ncbi:MAG TPA: extracellular solute-binding protein [Tepidisphaeraceae bacterium]|nr:extracellular solute-binding protein [Tepidisphaeraceae bacterium]
MTFNLGKPILAMLLIALVTGSAIWLRGTDGRRADVEAWVFADSHYYIYVGRGKPPGTAPIDVFSAETGRRAEIKLIQHRALNVRLATLILSDIVGPEVPDAVEIEIGSIGRFFRPPVDQVGLLPLNDFIRKYGWEGKILSSRLAPWSKEGVIFGIPHDVHPVTLTYRADLFEQAGIDLAAADTWEKFIDACLQYQAYWRAQGVERRWAMEWPQSGASHLLTLLLQRGINLVDDRGNIHFDDPRVLDTLVMYARLSAGPNRIGADVAPGEQGYTQDLGSGFIGIMLTPDWRLTAIPLYAPELAGKLKVMPLPKFPDSPYRTSTWGGTMIGIPRNSANPELAWKLIEILYLRPEGMLDTMRNTYILPPVTTLWDDPINTELDPFYSGQAVRALNVQLAQELPARYVSPASTVADATMSLVMIRAIRHMREHGEAGLEDACRAWLAQADRELRRRIAHGSFDDPPIDPEGVDASR